MQILVAPNAFKNCLTATAVADAIKSGLDQSRLKCTIDCLPIGDGGDGTADLLIAYGHGETIHASVHDPLGRMIASSFGLIDDGSTAVIEMANASGLRLLKSDELDPLHASSFGTGELIIQALNKNATKIILCVGGSATVDGGTGILQALGFKFLDKSDNELKVLPETLTQLNSIDFSTVDKRIYGCQVIVLCDVDNVLLGERGAAAVFGPQKGARTEDVTRLEASLSALRDVIHRQQGTDINELKHGGSAGGVAAALAGLVHAELVAGIDFFLSFVNYDEALKKTDIVITGEGSIDLQTLDGKGPFGIAKKAKEQGKVVIGVGGKIAAGAEEVLKQYFDVLMCINSEPIEVSVALLQAHTNLVKASKNIGDLLAVHIS